MKLFISLTLLCAGLVLWFWQGGNDEATAGAEVPLLRATRSSIADVVNATGVIKARNGAEVRVGSRVSGMLEQLHVDVGDQVSRGQLLAELDDEDMQVSVAILQARLDELQAQLAYSRLLLERNQTAAILPETELASLRMAVAADQARVQQARGSLHSEKLRLSWTRVVAPISGTIASVSTQQGETVAASFSAPTFLTIIDLSRLEIQAYVDESDIGKIVPGMAVHFGVDTYPGVRFDGITRTIYPKAEIVNNVVNYIVIIDLQLQPDYLLRPEMTTHLQFVIQESSNALTVPRSALFYQRSAGREGYYLLLPQDQRWEQRPVEVGIVNAATVEITAGLTEGSLYVSDHASWLAATVQ